MNKELFIEKLESITGLDNAKCVIVNDILENYFIIGKSNKDKIIDEIINQLEMSKEEAENIYEKAMSIIASGVKDKIKHPFKSQD